jgi:hypothetical protein
VSWFIVSACGAAIQCLRIFVVMKCRTQIENTHLISNGLSIDMICIISYGSQLTEDIRIAVNKCISEL